MRKICAKLGVERATPHDVRWTFYDQHRPEARLSRLSCPIQSSVMATSVRRVGNDKENKVCAMHNTNMPAMMRQSRFEQINPRHVPTVSESTTV